MNRLEKNVAGIIVGILAVMLTHAILNREKFDSMAKQTESEILSRKIHRAQPSDLLISEDGKVSMVLLNSTNTLTLLEGYKNTNVITLERATGKFIRIETGSPSQQDYNQALLRFVAQYDATTNK